MKMYIMIKANEDGRPVTLNVDIDDLLANPLDYGVTKFLDDVPNEHDPNYWEEGHALLIQAIVVCPKKVTVQYKLES